MIGLLFAVGAFSNIASAQDFPGWSVTQNSSTVYSQSVSIVQVPTGNGGTEVFSVGVTNNSLYYSISTDGVHYDGSEPLGSANGQGNSNQFYDVYCNATLVSCGASAIYFDNALYIAFADGSSHGLTVLKGTLLSSNSGIYSFNTFYQYTGPSITSTPAMVITPGNRLLIRFGTSNNSSYKNETDTSVFDGSNWTNYTNTGGLAPTQSAMVNFNGHIYAIDKQDNSSNGVFVSQVDETGTYIAGTAYQVPGWYTAQGISAMVYKGSIVAAIQQDASSHYMYVFSSTDGANWSSQEYTNKLNSTPAICTFNGGAALATIANDSSYYLYASFVTN